MKLARYGDLGTEKPALIDDAGVLRDLSAHTPDINPALLSDLSQLDGIDPQSLPVVAGQSAFCSLRCGDGQIYLHRLELF